LFAALLTQDAGVIISLLDRAIAGGRESSRLIQQLMTYTRDLLVIKTMGQEAQISAVSPSARKGLTQQAELVDYERLLKGWELFSTAAEAMRFSDSQRLQLELVLLQMAELWATPSMVKPAKEKATPVAREKPEVSSSKTTSSEEALNWNQVVDQVKARKVTVSALLAPARLVGIQENMIVVGYRKGYKFHRERMLEKENRELLISVLTEMLGRPMEVSFVSLDDGADEDPIVKKLTEAFGADRVHIKD
ncbi:MAG: hypothetical protein ACM3O9_06970, partial [Methylocystaceae bacterium]